MFGKPGNSSFAFLLETFWVYSYEKARGDFLLQLCRFVISLWVLLESLCRLVKDN